MIYCDPSFLLALYDKTDGFSPQANQIAAKFKEPIPLTLLGELELVNGMGRSLAVKRIDQGEYDAIFRQISQDESEGILLRCPVDQKEYFAKARELSRKFIPEISVRTLDILHIAAAVLLKATEFASFDKKQKLLVEKVGLKLCSETMIRKRA